MRNAYRSVRFGFCQFDRGDVTFSQVFQSFETGLSCAGTHHSAQNLQNRPPEAPRTILKALSVTLLCHFTNAITYVTLYGSMRSRLNCAFKLWATV